MIHQLVLEAADTRGSAMAIAGLPEALEGDDALEVAFTLNPEA